MRAARCDKLPEDCVADHICRVLDARPQPSGGWAARCPAHSDDRASLKIDLGTQGARIVLKCHRGCSYRQVRDAMIRRGISPGCLGRTGGTSSRTASEDAEKLARIEQVLTDPPAGRELMRIELAMIVWGCDRHAAAAKLGIGWRTAYRARDAR